MKTTYTIQQLAQLAGVSSRTLRYYDGIGLLKPMAKNESGYRTYGPEEVDRLQQILLYKTCGLSLEKIQEILNRPEFEVLAALREQKEALKQQQAQMQVVVQTIERTIKHLQGEIHMSDTQKFVGLKHRMLEENEAQYGDEVRERWGSELQRKSNKKFSNKSQEQYERILQQEQDFKEALETAFAENNPLGSLAAKAVELHKTWLLNMWPTYSADAHRGLAQMYFEDIRFHHYFGDRKEVAEFFLKAVKANTE